jgi:Ca2+-transporting ATPase
VVASKIRPRRAPAFKQAKKGLSKSFDWSGRVLCLGLKKFSRIDGHSGQERSPSMRSSRCFPLMVLLVTIASLFVDRDRAGKEVIAYVETYVPISGELQRHIF